jgi:GTPase
MKRAPVTESLRPSSANVINSTKESPLSSSSTSVTISSLSSAPPAGSPPQKTTLSSRLGSEGGERSLTFDGQQQENDEGNTEYKIHLCGLDATRIQSRATQMRFRINEGSGECFYYLGVSDDGTVAGIDEPSYIESIENLRKIAHLIDCIVLVLEEKVIKSTRRAGYFLIREAEQSGCYVSLSVGVVGNVDAGKSTTVGTLTKGIVDDGRGRARLAVFNHKHEISTGRTSSIGHQILGFDAHGEVVNNRNDRSPTWVEIVNQSTKVVTFWDLAGHERYLRTTINGLTTMAPDYCLVLVGANMGPNHMTREHIYLCLTLKIPFILLVSKIDMVPPNVLEETMTKLHEIVKKGAKRTPFSIKSVDDVLICAKTIKSESIVPILQVSPSSFFYVFSFLFS